MKKLIILLILFGFLFADIGPSPEPPSITINLMSEGNAYSGYMEITYVCDVPSEGLPEGSSPVDDRIIEFACTEGTCVNSYWFYKLNPCFSGAEGHFEYNFLGEDMQTNTVTFEEEQTYNLYLDLDTGTISDEADNGDNGVPADGDNTPLCGAPALILLLSLYGVKHAV